MKTMILVARHTVATVMIFLILVCGQSTFADDSPGQWFLVTPPVFRPALAPLIEHRRAEGFNVMVLETTEVLTREQLRQRDGSPLQARLNHLLGQHKSRNYLLLAGPLDAADPTNAENTVVPGLSGNVGRMKGEPCDFGYALPGPDGVPTVSVGRFPARNAEELRAVVLKTLSFEQDCQPAPWRNHLLLLLGNPGGGSLAEIFVEQVLRKDLALLHPSWEVRTIFNAPSSRYYLPRPQDRETAIRYLQDGQLFSVYLGHSGAAGLGLDGKFISREDWGKLNIPQGRGPFFTCGCFACQSAGTKGEGYGLAAMRNPVGPVAVIGATGESYSALGQLAAEGLLTCLSQPPFPSRLGDHLLAIQAGLARGKMDATTFALLDMADGTGGKVPLATQRLEHLEMWMLLGDPALRMPIVPMDILLQAPEPAAGRILKVAGVLPDRLRDATVRITLERPLDSAPTGLEQLPPQSPENRQARIRAIAINYERANSFTIAAAEAKSRGRNFATALEVPADLPWSNLILRASATRSNETGLGVLTLTAKAVEQ